MKRPTTAWTLALASLLAAGCGDDDVSRPQPTEFGGQWVLVSTVVAKMVCPDAQPDDFTIDAVDIRQDGSEVSLEFGTHTLPGTVQGGVLRAEGIADDGASVQLELRRAGDRLEGAAEVSGETCLEQRTVQARPRTADADFSGHWGFSLTVAGEPGCPHISDYDDCFRILQTGTDLLVVDDEGGNLAGRVIGDVARIDRDTAAETTSLLFHIDPAADQLSGTAIRVFSDPACRTVLEFVGQLRDEPCAGVVP